MLSKEKKGAGLVEVVVAAGIVGLVMISLIAGFSLFVREGLASSDRVEAALLGEEGIEAALFWRDAGWQANIGSLTPGLAYYLYFDQASAVWKATTTVQIVSGKFYRSLVISNVLRDASSQIAAAGTNDPGTKKVQVTVSWRGANGTTTRQLSTYLLNLYAN